MTRRRSRVVAATVAAIALTLAACGTRVNHAEIVAAGSEGGGEQGIAGAGPGELGAGGPAADGSAGPDGQTAAKGSGSADGRGGTGSGAGGQGGTGSSGGRSGGPPIVIGSVGTYSGPAGASWAQGPRALQAWAAATNAKGGINGRNVQVIVYDDGGDTAKARSQVNELVEQRKAVAIVAAMTTGAALPSWKGYVEEKKIPVVGGDCGPNWDGSPVLFRQCTSSADTMFGIAVIGAKYGKGKKLGGLFCQESADCSFAEEQLFQKGGAKRAGLDPRYRARISITQPDFTSECIQARNAGVELLFVAGDPNTVGRVASSCRRQNFNPQFLQPDATVGASTPSKAGLGDVLVGIRTFPFTGVSGPAYQEFAAAWAKHGGGQPPGPVASMGWAAAKVFERAAKAAGGDISRASLIKRLYALKGERFGGLTVPLSFSPSGSSASKCLFVMKGSGGKWTAPRGDRPQCF